jgi:hypothetical protein
VFHGVLARVVDRFAQLAVDLREQFQCAKFVVKFQLAFNDDDRPAARVDTLFADFVDQPHLPACRQLLQTDLHLPVFVPFDVIRRVAPGDFRD